MAVKLRGIEREEVFKQLPEVIKKTFNQMVNIYNAVSNIGMQFFERGKVVENVREKYTVRSLLKIENDYVFVLTPEFFEAEEITIAEVLDQFRGVDKVGYALEFRGNNKIMTINLPPASIADTVNLLLNKEVISSLNEKLSNETIKAFLTDILMRTEKIFSFKIDEKNIDLDVDISEGSYTLFFERLGKNLKSLNIHAEYLPSADSTLYEVTALFNVKGDEILYFIPSHDHPDYIDSFMKMLKLADAIKEFMDFANHVQACEKVFKLAYKLHNLLDKDI